MKCLDLYVMPKAYSEWYTIHLNQSIWHIYRRIGKLFIDITNNENCIYMQGLAGQLKNVYIVASECIWILEKKPGLANILGTIEAFSLSFKCRHGLYYTSLVHWTMTQVDTYSILTSTISIEFYNMYD